jgi:hypothetical protein
MKRHFMAIMETDVPGKIVIGLHSGSLSGRSQKSSVENSVAA